MPPGARTGPPPRPASYPVPPGSFGPPRLPPSAHRLPGVPPPTTKKTYAPVIVVIVAVALLVVVTCSVGIYKIGSSTNSGNGRPHSGPRSGARPSLSFDKSKTPAPVTELRSALVSVADITAVLKAPRDTVGVWSEGDNLQNGLSSLNLCADGAVAGYAIAGSETNSFKVSGAEGTPIVSSAVAGFYGDEAKVFFASLRTQAERCGWTQLQTAQLGDEVLGIFTDNGSSSLAIVFVRSGRAVIEVVVTGKRTNFLTVDHTSYQSDTIQLATAMVKRLPKSAG
jgi:hypothetical protein